jgi:hypothetical protein
MSNQSHSSIGNWIQCRETLNPGDSDKQVVCGKWRRYANFLFYEFLDIYLSWFVFVYFLEKNVTTQI